MSAIVVALDGSRLAEHALPHALARLPENEELVLLQVVSSASEVTAAQDYLNSVKAGLACPAARVSVCVRRGTPVEEIVQSLAERESDLLVIASHGHSGWRRATLGSVAEGVTRRSPCPVWLAREEHPPREVLGTVVVALDSGPHGEAALDFVHEWLERPQRLLLLGATDLATDLSTTLADPELARTESLERVTGYLENRAHWLRDKGHPCEIEARDATALEAILTTARREAADLVVVGTHARSGPLRWALGSVAESAMREAPCPVAVVGPDATWSRRS